MHCRYATEASKIPSSVHHYRSSPFTALLRFFFFNTFLMSPSQDPKPGVDPVGDREFCSLLTFDAARPGTYWLVVEGAPAEDGPYYLVQYIF